ncbi:MAG: hypothetical protein QOI07_2506 [Verrucomicrobiota bacterium]|jgi:hypothetical protein
MTAVEIYESVTNGGASDFAAVIAILQRHGPWCLIGGLAVNCYVEPVYTVDADIVVITERTGAIADELAAAGFRVQRFPHSINAKKPQGDLNVQFTQDERYQPFVTRATSRQVLGQTVPVAAVRDIVQGKVWAWEDAQRRLSKRKKDELDLIRLGEAYPELRVEMPRAIVAQLEGDTK